MDLDSGDGQGTKGLDSLVSFGRHITVQLLCGCAIAGLSCRAYADNFVSAFAVSALCDVYGRRFV